MNLKNNNNWVRLSCVVKNYADRRWYYSSYMIYITQKPDPLISNYYYSMKGANVIDFFFTQ